MKLTVTLLAVLALLLTGSLYYVLSASLPSESGAVPLKGLSDAVTVSSDQLGIPAIDATNRHDAFRTLGFLHARDRLLQMDLMRRKSAGRLAEIFGGQAVMFDQSQRDYQLNRAAERILLAMPEDQKSVLAAYVDGVNAYIDRANILPPEFIGLGYQPEPWRAADSVLVILGMFQILNGQEQDERMLSVMAKILPENLIKFLTPDTDIYATVLLGGDKSHRPATDIPVSDFNALTAENIEVAKDSVNAEMATAGSNNWVVSGKKTADGRAIIANDMHLRLGAPNIWYRVELYYPESALSGLTLPGLPALIVGANRHVAWGFTNATADFLDLISLEINPNNNQEYLTPQGWRAFDKRTEIIKVKDGKDIRIERLSTIWGPVSTKPLLGHPVAIKWTALEADAVDLGMLNMDKVKSTAEAMTVLNQIGAPAQNALIADTAGHIGWTYMGRFPKRRGFDGLISQSWANGAIAWDGFIPATELPRLLDPPAGFIATANNRTLGQDYPHILGYNWALGYRAYRIAELLQQKNALTEADMLAIQLDTRSEIFDFYRDLALKAVNGGADSPIATTLRNWDGHMNSDSKGVALLIAFRAKLADAVFAKVVERCRLLEPDFNYAWREMETPLRQLLTQQPKGVLPAQYQDDWGKFIVQTLNTTAEDLAKQYPNIPLEKLEWGTVNRISIAHPLSQSLPTLASWLNISDFNSDGCASFCVKVISNSHGASERLALSPAHPENGILEMPGGQSGHPLSSHYRDQQPFWQAGEISAFLPGKAINTLRFVPQTP